MKFSPKDDTGAEGGTPVLPSGPSAPVDTGQKTEEERLQELEKERADKAAAAAGERTHAEEVLARALRDRNEKYLLKIGRITLWSFLILIVLTFLLTVPALGEVNGGVWAIVGTPAEVIARLNQDKHAVLLAAVAALILWIILAAVSVAKRESGRLTGMLIGRAGRLSTSYFQAWVWTLVIGWAFLFFVLLAAVGGPAFDLGGDSLISVNTDYLLLLGGPFAALLIAMQINQSKVAAGELQSVPASETTVTDLFSSDSGRTDLVDTQYLLFNGVALFFFFGAMIGDHTALPDIPDQLILLTSGAALGYVARTAISRNAPIITSIVPTGGDAVPTIGRRITITGQNFVPAGGETPEALNKLRVKFGDAVVAPILPEGELTPRSIEVFRRSLTVEVPDLSGDGLADRTVEVMVITASGAETPAFRLRVYSPLLRARLEPLKVDDGIVTLKVRLLDTAKRAAPVRITVGTASFDALWTEDVATIQVAKATTDNQTVSAVSGGATWKAHLALPTP